MEITKTIHLAERAAWRKWLAENHDSENEIWLVSYTKASGKPAIPYIETVEEALCFGWIDGIAKKMDAERSAQRFTPRRPRSNWTELNKDRARRLIDQGLMTDAGRAKLPDISLEAFTIAGDILAALREDPQTWAKFQAFPESYKRIRVGFIEEQRKQPEVFKTRLANFLKKTRQNKMFGVLK